MKSTPNEFEMMMMLKEIVKNLKVQNPKKRHSFQPGRKESKFTLTKQRHSCLDSNKLKQMFKMKR